MNFFSDRNFISIFFRFMFVVLLITVMLALGKAIYEYHLSLCVYGVNVTYFKDFSQEKKIITKSKMKLLESSSRFAPAMFVPKKHYSSRWDGWLLVPDSTNYYFFAQSEDGLIFYIDNQVLVDNWREQKWSESGVHASVFLTRGIHRLTVKYYKNGNNGALRIRWTGGRIPKNTVLSAPYLFKEKKYAQKYLGGI